MGGHRKTSLTVLHACFGIYKSDLWVVSYMACPI